MCQCIDFKSGTDAVYALLPFHPHYVFHNKTKALTLNAFMLYRNLRSTCLEKYQKERYVSIRLLFNLKSSWYCTVKTVSRTAKDNHSCS